MIAQEYLGQSLAFPVAFDSNGGAVFVAGSDNIKQCVVEVLSTPQGSLYFNRPYGSRLHRLQWETIDAVLISLTRTLIKEAIETWEPRVLIDDIEVELTPDNQKVHSTIFYTEINTRKRDYVTTEFNRITA